MGGARRRGRRGSKDVCRIPVVALIGIMGSRAEVNAYVPRVVVHRIGRRKVGRCQVEVLPHVGKLETGRRVV